MYTLKLELHHFRNQPTIHRTVEVGVLCQNSCPNRYEDDEDEDGGLDVEEEDADVNDDVGHECDYDEVSIAIGQNFLKKVYPGNGNLVADVILDVR